MNYISISDIDNLSKWVQGVRIVKKQPFAYDSFGKHKTLGLLFFNPSLRTRMSTQRAAQNLGMDTIVINVNKDSWALEFENGVRMNSNTSEHIKEAAAVISQYCDVIAVRAFSSLENKQLDKSEYVINGFKKYAKVPVINMESATAHPLQGLADAVTIAENSTLKRPKIVLSWAPHPKALPHAVPNSFVRFMKQSDVDLYITHPKGYDLDPHITKNIPIIYNQREALKEADFVYAKNWCSYINYGKVLPCSSDWMITVDKINPSTKFMHCLPVRRNVVVADGLIDSSQSLVIEQANNRTYATQYVLKKLLEYGK